MSSVFKLFFALVVSTCFLFGDGKLVRLTSLEWPPYASDFLPEKGLSVLIAKKAFEAEGYKLEVEFFPWKRAVALAQNDDKYDGYFPEYFSSELEKEFIISDSLGESPLGLIERRDNPLKWSSVEELKNYKIGTVQGYINTVEFDKYAASGVIKVEAVNDDSINVKKVAGNRIDGAVIDRLVFEYMVSSDPSLGKFADSLSFNSKLLENKSLHICFKKGSKGEALEKVFNEGLKKIDAKKITQEYMSTLTK